MQAVRPGSGIVSVLSKQGFCLVLFSPQPVEYILSVKDKPRFLPQTHKQAY